MVCKNCQKDLPKLLAKGLIKCSSSKPKKLCSVPNTFIIGHSTSRGSSNQNHQKLKRLNQHIVLFVIRKRFIARENVIHAIEKVNLDLLEKKI